MRELDREQTTSLINGENPWQSAADRVFISCQENVNVKVRFYSHYSVKDVSRKRNPIVVYSWLTRKPWTYNSKTKLIVYNRDHVRFAVRTQISLSDIWMAELGLVYFAQHRIWDYRSHCQVFQLCWLILHDLHRALKMNRQLICVDSRITPQTTVNVGYLHFVKEMNDSGKQLMFYINVRKAKW